MQLKKMVTLALTIILGTTLLVACTSNGNATTQQASTAQTEVQDSDSPDNTDSSDSTEGNEPDSAEVRTVIVGTVGRGEPYSKIDDAGVWTGVEAELWAEVEERTGWTIEVKQVSDLASLFGELSTGRVDVAANCFAITEARLESYIASSPLYADAQVIVVEPESEYMTLEDLRGETIGVTAGQASQATVEALAPDYDWEVITYEDSNAGFQDCDLGRITAFAHTVTSIEKAERAQGLEFRMLNEKLFGNNVGWWFEDTDEGAALRDELNVTIEEMHNDGTIAEIVTKWFYEDLTQLISDEWLTATH